MGDPCCGGTGACAAGENVLPLMLCPPAHSRQFKYSPGGVELVGFNTRLVDHGIGLQKIHDFPGRTAADPQPSPAMAGGLFTVDRSSVVPLSRCVVLCPALVC